MKTVPARGGISKHKLVRAISKTDRYSERILGHARLASKTPSATVSSGPSAVLVDKI